MPDAWEVSKGLNVGNASDRNLTNLSSEGYTNLEVYLNDLMAPLYGLAGDFNADNKVDAADYATWRKGFGSTYTAADFQSWRAHFGESTGGGAGTGGAVAVPEPTSCLVLLCAAVMYGVIRRTRLRRQ
jgi:hypothetical protein